MRIMPSMIEVEFLVPRQGYRPRHNVAPYEGIESGTDVLGMDVPVPVYLCNRKSDTLCSPENSVPYRL